MLTRKRTPTFPYTHTHQNTVAAFLRPPPYSPFPKAVLSPPLSHSQGLVFSRRLSIKRISCVPKNGEEKVCTYRMPRVGIFFFGGGDRNGKYACSEKRYFNCFRHDTFSFSKMGKEMRRYSPPYIQRVSKRRLFGDKCFASRR